MSLDKIPELDLRVIETHYHDRQSSDDRFLTFKQEVEKHLKWNVNLKQLIDTLALKSRDPNSVYETAYRLLDVLNAQLEVNELNQKSKLNYDERKK